MRKLPVAILISGRGTNMQALIDAARTGELPVDIRVVISNRPGAAGLQRANDAGIATRVLDHEDFASREAFDAALAQLIDQYGVELLLLAGFMRVLTPAFVARYAGRMLNIHPSLLPAYQGLHTHERVLAAGDKQHGTSVHFVTDQLDGGPVIVQAAVPVLEGDDPDTLAARVLVQEHRIFPLAVRWYAEGRIRLVDNRVMLDGKPLASPVQLSTETAGAEP